MYACVLLLPPNQPFFRLAIQGKAKEQVQEQPELKTLIEKSLAKIEREVMGKIESLAIRVPIFEAIKHLIVGGNVLCHMPKEGSMRVFPLNQYVCKRDGEGNLLEIVVKVHFFFFEIEIFEKVKVRVRVRVRSSKIEVRCGSACGSIIEVRVCVRHTAKFLATQRLNMNGKPLNHRA